jgi:hypothetical protein
VVRQAFDESDLKHTKKYTTSIMSVRYRYEALMESAGHTSYCPLRLRFYRCCDGRIVLGSKVGARQQIPRPLNESVSQSLSEKTRLCERRSQSKRVVLDLSDRSSPGFETAIQCCRHDSENRAKNRLQFSGRHREHHVGCGTDCAATP